MSAGQALKLKTGGLKAGGLETGGLETGELAARDLSLAASLEVARESLTRAAAEMERAAGALELAQQSAAGDARGRLALMAEVVSTQKDLAAGLAVLARTAPEGGLDLCLASAAFGRGQDAPGAH